MLGLDEGINVVTPNHKGRSKRKHNFGTSSCEKERKCPNEFEKTSSSHSFEKDFPALGDMTGDENFTPVAGARKSWYDMTVEEEKENASKKNGTEQEIDESSFKSRRRLAMTSVAGKESLNMLRINNKPNPVSKDIIRKQILTDIDKLRKRQRQIDIGKNTLEYGNFLKKVPREKRMKDHPLTPDKFQLCSTRSWQGQLKVWRRKLHMFDSPEMVAEYRDQLCEFMGMKGPADLSGEEGSGDDASSNEETPPSAAFNEFTPL